MPVLDRAIASAKEAPPGSVPTTVKEARRALTLSTIDSAMAVRRGGLIVAAVALAGLALWVNNPLPLLAAVAMGLLLGDSERVILAGDHLWVIRPKAEPYAIPVSAVESFPQPLRHYTIRTRDPHFSELRLPMVQGGDLVSELKRRLSGEPAKTSGTAEPVLPEHRPVARCTLCGRPDPAGSRAGAIYICDLCAGRTRVQAGEAGHGLTGKEPKPM